MHFRWFLCGRSTRWYRAVCRFGPETLGRPTDRLSIAEVAPAQIGHAARQSGGAVALWPFLEMSEPERKGAFSALGALSHSGVRTLNVIEPPDEWAAVTASREAGTSTPSERRFPSGMLVDLMQLGGGSVVVYQPQDLPRFASAIRRFWDTVRPAEEPVEAYFVRQAPPSP